VVGSGEHFRRSRSPEPTIFGSGRKTGTLIVDRVYALPMIGMVDLMKLALFLTYVVIEIAAFVGLCFAIGVAWTVLLGIATVVLGFWLLRRQGAKVLSNLRTAGQNAAAGVPAGPAGSAAPVADTALLAGATIAMVVPGLVTTVIGILLLLKPVRAVLRPLVIALGTRKVVVAMESYAQYGRGMAGVTVVDGHVVDTPDSPTTYDPNRRQLPNPHPDL
jgi:UPF0716 protein FxsA